MTSTASQERKALVSALRSVTAEAPTLCEGWSAQDLALHVVVRDSRPDLMVGQQLPLVGPRARRALQTLRDAGYEALVDRVAAGPPRYFPQSLEPVDVAMNTLEYYIHTEDVLRAQPGFQLSERRRISEELRKRIWQHASLTFFVMAARKQNRRITFFSPGYGATTRGPAAAPLMMVHGAPEELTLWASGRAAHAEADITEA
ncbi:TIGR03085 family metal-binding protein [Nesterenkonia sphaerica]|uniref:TIGR03085 family protein n=1 Tax=Nesterenkonia sphaerica TaxID=1804988 RepID=A0A5R8ZZV1_9MICC|nr:TIGR03085 family metal-binding protein [Nesterenkonia sphaerica]TLP71959.1 TIGR03085 family protein [Nesterenkonia sphaerica]